MEEMKGLEPDRIVRLERDAVVVLDQRRLPEEEVELRLESSAEVAEAIRSLAIRRACWRTCWMTTSRSTPLATSTAS